MSKKLTNQIIIGVFNNKGGVGKSTIVNSIASNLAIDSYKTLIIDADSQCHQTKYFNQDNLIILKTLEDLIINQELINSGFLYTDVDNLYLLSNAKQISSSTFSGFSALEQLKAIKNILPDNEFDFILIDLPPTLDLPALNCLLACDYILSPVEYSELAKDGLLNLISSFGKVKEYNPKLEFLGCFGCKVNNSFKNTKKFRTYYQQYPDIFLNTEIRQNQSFTKLPTIGKNIFQVDDTLGQSEVRNLTDEILTKIIKLKIK